MKTIGAVFLFVVIIVGLLAIGGAMLLSLAYGLGLLFSWLTHFELFQATVLALIAILAAGILVERIWKVIISSNSGPLRDKLDSIDTDDEDDFEEDEDEEIEKIFTNPGIPRWRQPLKQIDFSNVAPDARCPCGSGRKYKNCHGATKGSE